MPDKVVVRLITRKPADEGDIPEPEQTYVYHWHRILAALVVLVAVVAGGFAGFRHFYQAQKPVAQASIESAAAPRINVPPSPQPVPSSKATGLEAKSTTSSAPSLSATAEETGEGQSKVEDVSQSSVVGAAKVSIRSPSIKRAQLTSNVEDGQPVDKIGPVIPMNEQGLVKVFLWTQLDDIKGRKMFHDWYWKGKRVFHARIPVTRNHQTGTSIKFIDRSMTGPWEVKVVDHYNRVYAEARFEVR